MLSLMNNIAYLANPPYLAQVLHNLWPQITTNSPLVAFDAQTPGPTVVLGDAKLPRDVPCLVVSTSRVAGSEITWVAASLNSASLVQHLRLWLASLADAPLTLKDGTVFNPRTRQFGALMLTEKEVATLQFLWAQPKHTASRAALQQHVWGYAPDADTHTVETHIYRLRQKIESNPSKPCHVVTTDDGYCLII